MISFNWPEERPHYATVVRVVDGDTVRFDIDMDLKLGYSDYPIRLFGCAAASNKTEAGKAAQANLETRLPVGTKVILTMIKDYKYGGEFVAKIWLEDGTDFIAQLIQEQWLAYWNGRGTQPAPAWPRTSV